MTVPRAPGIAMITSSTPSRGASWVMSAMVLPGAYAGSFRLNRGDTLVSVDFARAMRGDREANLFVRNGDRLIVEQDPRTVFITGAVSRPALIRYQSGLSVQDYIDLAGGATERGDRLKAVVSYPSGFSRPVRKVALFDAWFHEVRNARWKSTADAKRLYGTASVLNAERIAFNIKGNDYRLVVALDFAKSIVCIKWLGTHREYDDIDATEVEHE